MDKETVEKRIFKWIAGILLLGGIVGGCFLIYRWWTKPTPEQIQQNEKLKEKMLSEIKEFKNKASNNIVALKRAKEGLEYGEFEVFDEWPKRPVIDPSDKELEELGEEWAKAWSEYNESTEAAADWLKIKDDYSKSLWERQKNGQWKVLTDKLDKSSAIRARFDKIIKVFYHRFGEKKGIKIHEPRIDFRGFGHFYIKENEVGTGTEMAHTSLPDGENIVSTSTNGGSAAISHYPMEINFNQIYLLNHGTIGMEEFHLKEPKPSERGIGIDFDHLIETFAHEIAHALQNVMNIDKSRESIYLADNGTYPIINSQCESSGERDAKNNLLHSDWAAEHAVLTNEIKQMIESSAEYQEFKEWWQSSKI